MISRMNTEDRGDPSLVHRMSMSGDRCSPVLADAIRTAVRHLDAPALARLQVDLEQTMRTPAEVAWLRRVFAEVRRALQAEIAGEGSPGDTAGRIASAAIGRAKGG